MKIRFLLLLFVTTTLWTACGADVQKNESAEEISSGNNGEVADNKSNEGLPDAVFTEAEENISDGIIRILTDGVWHYEGVLNMKAEKTMQKGEGRWVQFLADGTFEYGTFDKVERKGKWQFLEKKYIIELIYDDNPSELLGFRCQFGGEETVVLIGDSRYQTNAIQMKWNKFDLRPEKE